MRSPPSQSSRPLRSLQAPRASPAQGEVPRSSRADEAALRAGIAGIVAGALLTTILHRHANLLLGKACGFQIPDRGFGGAPVIKESDHRAPGGLLIECI